MKNDNEKIVKRAVQMRLDVRYNAVPLRGNNMFGCAINQIC
ncbi:hypothetical protein GPLA_0941 [Paraglaciecola polaris LMG 21857]|uniref:Uncharacterized protein n=1 Tax=Paraglaciecola polaris LMG 21857 TaxID=1129793 RepID=K6ZNJ7_9ALTE|nr:hypothetical protein GPLA_0941 [Paraglaciecola polaris LMG 21857]